MTEFEKLKEKLKACRQCRELFGYEPRPVQWGSADAKIVHISQAPGAKVHEIGRPFADASGRKLRNEWYHVSDEIFYDPHSFYFTMAGHCYPGKGVRGDKKPPKQCWTLWSEKELEHLKDARLYLVVGGEAASRLFPKRKLTDLVFEDHELNGKPCYVLPHPSGLNGPWFKQHPEFEEKRMPEIRRKIHEVLDLDDGSENQKNIQNSAVDVVE